MKKYSGSGPHKTLMFKWISHCAQKKRQSSIISQLESSHQKIVKRNRDHISLQIIIECLQFTAQQNVAQRAHAESRPDLGAVSDVNRGNFLELLHMRSRDIPWLLETLTEKLAESQSQWTSPVIQNELLGIISDFVLQRILSDVRDSGAFGIIIDETSDISRCPYALALVLKNDIGKIINVFASRKGRASAFFQDLTVSINMSHFGLNLQRNFCDA